MYEGEAFRASTGQWAWRVKQDGVEIVGGGGYPSEEEAIEAMRDELEQRRIGDDYAQGPR
jgi:hypothetical protein